MSYSCFQPVSGFPLLQDKILTPNYSALTPASVSEHSLLTPFTPSTSHTRLFSVPIFAQATLSTWNTVSPSQPSSFRFSSTLSPLEPLPNVSFKMVLPAPWWSRLVVSPSSCSSGHLSLSQIILLVCLLVFGLFPLEWKLQEGRHLACLIHCCL